MQDFNGDPADICQSCRHDRGSHLCGAGKCGFCPCATFAADPASIYAPALERLTDELVGRVVAEIDRLTPSEAESIASGYLPPSAVAKVSPAMRAYHGAEVSR